MTTELLLLLGVSPCVVAIVTIIVAVVKLIANGKHTENTIVVENTELKEKLMLIHNENRELKRLLKEHLIKIDRIARSTEE